jgi:hypothetical protein
MGRLELLRGSRGRAAIAALILVILAAGLCYFDQDQDGLDDHAMLQDLCLLALLVPIVILPLSGLLAHGFAVDLKLPVLPAVLIPVPSPPPRRSRLV